MQPRAPDIYVTAIVARWHAATTTLRWINCGHPPAYMVDVEGNLIQIERRHHVALGTGEEQPTFISSERRLHSGERLILLTDGIIQRRMEDGEMFGVNGLKTALETATNPTAAYTAMAIYSEGRYRLLAGAARRRCHHRRDGRRVRDATREKLVHSERVGC